MPTDSPISTKTEEATREISQAVGLYQQSKGKSPKGVTEAQKHRWEEHVATMLSDAEFDAEGYVKRLSSLPPSVLAHGALLAWLSMSKDRRSSYLRWIGSLDSDRALGQKSVLIPGLLEIAPDVSVNLLCTLTLNKDAKERLGSSLIGGATDKLGLLFENDTPRYKIPDLLARLLELTQSPKVGVGERWRTIKLVFMQIIVHSLYGDDLGESLLRRLEVQLTETTMDHYAHLLPGVAQNYADFLDESEADWQRFGSRSKKQCIEIGKPVESV
jgi:hypothetical protein